MIFKLFPQAKQLQLGPHLPINRIHWIELVAANSPSSLEEKMRPELNK